MCPEDLLAGRPLWPKRAASGRNHRGDPPRTILGRFALFTWPGIYGDAVFEGLVTTPRHRHTPVPFPPPSPHAGGDTKSFRLGGLRIPIRFPPGARTRDGQTKSFLSQVTRWRRQKQLPSLELESPCGESNSRPRAPKRRPIC